MQILWWGVFAGPRIKSSHCRLRWRTLWAHFSGGRGNAGGEVSGCRDVIARAVEPETLSCEAQVYCTLGYGF
jgi:hypothetical protein